MRKIFATLKSVVAAALVVSMTLAVSCSYDDTAVKNDIKNLKGDLAELTERVVALENAAKAQAPTLEELLDGKAVIVEVTTNENGDQVIKLSNGKEITVLAPAACECDEPLQYRVVDGVLEVSADGNNWVAINGVAANQVVASVVINEDGSATITLANGEEFTVGVAELIECAATRSQVYVVAGTTKAVRFTINDAVEDINVMNQPFGWSATVEEYVEVEDEDDDFGGDVMPLAAGGKEYVLNITGPAKDFAQAAKEGVVSVHFNTAAGACKVMKVEVTLAEITLEVKDEYVTLTNTVAFEQADYWGRKYTDFADFYIGVIDAEDYAQYGDKVFVDTFDDYDCVYSANVNCTTRTTGFQNIVDLMFYEDGTCEKESYTFSVEQLARMFEPIYNFEVGGEYIIFVTLDTEVVGYAEQPVLTTAIMAEYTPVLVDAQIVEGSEKWNDVTVNFNLAGFDYYAVGWLSVAEVEEYMSYGDYASADEFIAEYVNAYGVMSAGALLSGEHLDATYNLSELAAISYTEWAPQLLADTEYYFFVYPFNAKDQKEMYQHNFVAENLRVYGTFATAALVAGKFEAGAEFEVVSHTEKAIDVKVTFAEDIKTVMYSWYSTAFLDPEEALADLMDPYNWEANTLTFDEETTYLETSESSYYGIDNPITLVMVAINTNGEYVVIQKEFYLEPTYVLDVQYTSADFVDGVLTLKGETNKDAISIAVNPGLETLVAGDYVPAAEDWTTGVCQVQWSSADAKEIFANATSFDYTGNPNSYPYYVTANFKMNVAVEGDVYTIVATDKVSGIGYVKFSFTGTFGIEEEESAAVVFTSATAVLAEGQANWHDVTFANGTDTVVIRIATYGTTKCLYGKYAQRDYGQDCCINGYPDTSTWNGVSLWPVTMDVVDNGDGTLSVTIEATEYGGNGDSHVGTFTGVIEGLTFEQPEVAPEFTIPGDGVTYDLELRYTKLVDGLDAANAVKVADENGYDWTIKFNPGLSSIEPGDYTAVQGFTTADALEVDTYNGGIGFGYSEYFYADAFDNVTINVQKNEDWYCITLIGQGGYDCPVSGKYRVVYIGKLVK